MRASAIRLAALAVALSLAGVAAGQDHEPRSYEEARPILMKQLRARLLALTPEGEEILRESRRRECMEYDFEVRAQSDVLQEMIQKMYNLVSYMRSVADVRYQSQFYEAMEEHGGLWRQLDAERQRVLHTPLCPPKPPPAAAPTPADIAAANAKACHACFEDHALLRQVEAAQRRAERTDPDAAKLRADVARLRAEAPACLARCPPSLKLEGVRALPSSAPPFHPVLPPTVQRR